MNPAALQALDQGACVITATSRLSYELKSAYDKHQIKQGKNVWPTATVLSWDGWILDLWHKTSTHSTQSRLSNAQLQQLLCDIIETDLNKEEAHTEHGLAALWNIPATARTALDAWLLCHQWKISYTALQSSEQSDHARFGRWAARLYARLRDRDWVSTAQLPDLLIKTGFEPEQDAVLFGFDLLNAQQQSFIEFYRRQGAGLKQINSESVAASTISQHSFESTESEWQHVGAWARNKLLENPATKIGIITPDIENTRSVAENSLREQLIPDFFEHSNSDPFHFSIGEKLSDQPLVESALDCLSLLGNIEYKQLVSIFTSNYWGSESEQQLRAQLLIDLRRKMAYRFELHEFIETLSAAQKYRADHYKKVQLLLENLLEKLATLQTVKARNRSIQALSSWRDIFKSCLNSLGWPAPKLDSNEFQALQSWEHCLDEWIKLDMVCKPMTLMQAMQSLDSFCRETVFQARALTQAPIQIMGILEADELSFDWTWLAGFDEQAWPTSATTNPFIPINIQLEAGIPEASLPLQAELADTRTRQLCALSPEIIFSHARIQGDVELAISPVLPVAHKPEPAGLPAIFSLDDTIRAATPPLESRYDDVGYPYSEKHTRGGTGLIQKQSSCPFRAYASYRLRADVDDEPRIGMDNLERGSLLHKVLETLWQELENSDSLQQHIDQDTLDDLIHRHTQKHLKRFSARSGLGDGFVRAETRRLLSLITQWLQLEAERPAFTVAATELKCEYQVNGLSLNLSLDRVDRLDAPGPEDASRVPYLVMDYKSGNCSLKDWEGPRPDQPQLPLYFLALEIGGIRAQVDALSFAQIKPAQCEFIGISRLEDTLPDVESLNTLSDRTSFKKDIAEWSQLEPVWSTRIETIVGDYQQGRAHVDPKSSGSCTFCNFGPLCRIHTCNQHSVDGSDA